jgi:hypothetical protein
MDSLLWASTSAALSCVGKTSRTTPSRRTSTTTTRWAWARWPGSSASGSAAPCCCRRRHGCAGCPAGRPSRRRRVSGWHLSVTKFSGILVLFFHIFLVIFILFDKYGNRYENGIWCHGNRSKYGCPSILPIFELAKKIQ